MDSILWGNKIGLSGCIEKFTPLCSIGLDILEGDSGIRLVDGVEDALVAYIFF